MVIFTHSMDCVTKFWPTHVHNVASLSGTLARKRLNTGSRQPTLGDPRNKKGPTCSVEKLNRLPILNLLLNLRADLDCCTQSRMSKTTKSHWKVLVDAYATAQNVLMLDRRGKSRYILIKIAHFRSCVTVVICERGSEKEVENV